MKTERPIGIKLIAAIFFAEAAILFASAIAAYFWPEQRPKAVVFVFHHLPYFRNLPIAASGPMSGLPSILAILFGVWAATKGIGMWFMHGLVRMLVLIDLAGRFGDLFLALGLSGSKEFLLFTSDPDFVIAIIVNTLVLIYLLDSNTEKLFEHQKQKPRNLGAGWTDSE